MTKTTTLRIFICSAFLLGAGLSNAAGMMKAGLWEVGVSSDATKNMPKMTKEQMDMMRKNGVNMAADGSILTKQCISKEMAEQEKPTVDEKSGCKLKNYERKGSSFTSETICDNPNMKGTTLAKGTYSSDAAYTISSDFKGTAGGKPMTSHTDMTGKWLSADCGSVKPLPVAAKTKL